MRRNARGGFPFPKPAAVIAGRGVSERLERTYARSFRRSSPPVPFSGRTPRRRRPSPRLCRSGLVFPAGPAVLPRRWRRLRLAGRWRPAAPVGPSSRLRLPRRQLRGCLAAPAARQQPCGPVAPDRPRRACGSCRSGIALRAGRALGACRSLRPCRALWAFRAGRPASTCRRRCIKRHRASQFRQKQEADAIGGP